MILDAEAKGAEAESIVDPSERGAMTGGLLEDDEVVTGFRCPLARGRVFAGPTALMILEAATLIPGSTFGTERLPEGRSIQAVEALFTGSVFRTDGTSVFPGLTFGTDTAVDMPPMLAAAATELSVTIRSDLEMELADVFLTTTLDFEAGNDVARGNA